MSKCERLPHPMTLPKQKLTSFPSVNVILGTAWAIKGLNVMAGKTLTYYDIVLLSTLLSLSCPCSWSNLSRVIYNHPQHRQHRTFQNRLNGLVSFGLVKNDRGLGYSRYSIAGRGKACLIRFNELTSCERFADGLSC